MGLLKVGNKARNGIAKGLQEIFFLQGFPPAYVDPKGSDELLFWIWTLHLLFYFGIILHFCPWKAIASLKKVTLKQLTPLCSEDQVLCFSYLYHYRSFCFVNSRNVSNAWFASVPILFLRCLFTITGILISFYRIVCVIRKCDMGFQQS